MRISILTPLLLCIALQVAGQSSVVFLNKTHREVWLQNPGTYPYTLDSGSQQYQTIPLHTSNAGILNMVVIPPKGPYGTADGIYYLLKPNDTLAVTSDVNRKPILTHISDGQRTAELSFVAQHTASLQLPLPYTINRFIQKTALSKTLWGIELKARDKSFDSLCWPFINSAIAFGDSKSPDTNIGRWFRYYYLGSMIGYKLYAGDNLVEPLKSTVASFYKDSLTRWADLLTSCENCDGIPAYNEALQRVYQVRFGHLPEHRFIDTIANLTKGNNKNYLLSQYMIDRIEQTDDAEVLLHHFDAVCDDSTYKMMVHNNYQLHDKQANLGIDDLAVLVRADKTRTGFNQLLATLKGEVVYVDFWASWCKPCVAELPYSHKLKEKTVGKNIEMLYISVDTDFDKWIASRKSNGVDGANSYIMTEPDKNQLVKQIQLGPIPRYLIIDKTGKIVKLDAERPSNPDTYTTLLNLLNEPANTKR